MGAVYDAILGRRSIRRFQDKPISDEIVNKLLEAGRNAPSRGNSQPWRFVVVKDRAEIEALANASYKQAVVAKAAACIIVLGVIDPRPTVRARYKELVDAGVFDQETADIGEAHLSDWGWNELRADAALNSSIPATIMSLAALDFGLGSCWVKLLHDDEVLSIIGADREHYYNAGILAFGYPDQDPKARPRVPLSEIVYLDKVDEPYFT